MRIEINRITADGLMLEDLLDAQELDLNTPDILFISPIKVNANIHRIKNVISVELKIKSFFYACCSRCLKDIELPLECHLKLNYEIVKHQEFLDLNEDIRENIILNYPIRFLCKTDCKGLCPKCGKDLNEGRCNCS